MNARGCLRGSLPGFELSDITGKRGRCPPVGGGGNGELGTAAETVAANFYGMPTKVVTLWASSVTVTRDCATVTAAPWPRLLLDDVS